MNRDDKLKIIEDNSRHDGDTGSTEVQVALLTRRIFDLTEHLKIHKKDNHSRRGLFSMINHRRRLLSYLLQCDSERYNALVFKLGIRSNIVRTDVNVSSRS